MNIGSKIASFASEQLGNIFGGSTKAYQGGGATPTPPPSADTFGSLYNQVRGFTPQLPQPPQQTQAPSSVKFGQPQAPYPTPYPNINAINPVIRDVAASTGIPFEALRGLVGQESSFGTNTRFAPADSGTYGYLVGSTQSNSIPSASNDGKVGIYERYGVNVDNSTPMNTLNTAAKLFQVLKAKYGSYDQAYGNYSAGEFAPLASKQARAKLFRNRAGQ